MITKAGKVIIEEPSVENPNGCTLADFVFDCNPDRVGNSANCQLAALEWARDRINSLIKVQPSHEEFKNKVNKVNKG